MYIDSEDFAIVGLVFFILILLLVGNIQDKIKQKRFVEICKRENNYFYKRKSNEEITRFIIEDAIRIGLYVKKCKSIQEICDTWYYWHNYHRINSDITSVGVGSFDTSRKRKDTSFGMPYNFRPVHIDLNSIDNYHKAKP